MSTPRRDFLKAAVAGCALAGLPRLSGSQPAAESVREYYELRAYRLGAGAEPRLLERYLERALLPALREQKIGPVGVFNETSAQPASAHRPTLWVLIPYEDLTTFATMSAGLNRDPRVRASAAEYFTSPTKDTPAYERIDSSLLLAFAGMPKLVPPSFGRAPARVFELRRYESFSEAKALAKLDMFNDGEIDIMRDVALSPVFYGQALTGNDLPHLSYMTSGPDMAAHMEHWKAFSAHPAWLKMKVDPKYADTVSVNTKRFLTPTSYSEL